MWALALGILKAAIGPIFEFLNRRVEAKERMHISDNETLSKVGSVVMPGLSKADELNAQLRAKEGAFSPILITSIVGFLFPFAWHTWQVVLDSSRWVPAVRFWYVIPYIGVDDHVVGSWRVAALPGMFETTEHAVINSLFIGASTLVAGVAMIKAAKR